MHFNFGASVLNIDHLRFSNNQIDKKVRKSDISIQHIIDNGKQLQHFAEAGKTTWYLPESLLVILTSPMLSEASSVMSVDVSRQVLFGVNF